MCYTWTPVTDCGRLCPTRVSLTSYCESASMQFGLQFGKCDAGILWGAEMRRRHDARPCYVKGYRVDGTVYAAGHQSSR
ncbi:hypothetical protein GCM10023156_04550 [Novipirellula rosea]|uniref:Uncharacterized protein n=1 Tax=Novipirellula rosea TaxID=1031540 RepID=A0ABP8M713_9BACT